MALMVKPRILLGLDVGDGEKFLDIKGVISKLKAKKVLMGYTKLWAEIDLKPYCNTEITPLEEHIKRKWANISAETAGEQYTPDDVIALISEIIAAKIEESDTWSKYMTASATGGTCCLELKTALMNKRLNIPRLTDRTGIMPVMPWPRLKVVFVKIPESNTAIP